MQRDGFEQFVEIDLLGRRHFDFQRLAAHGFDLNRVLQQFGTNPIRLGVGLVDLVDRNNHRHLGGLGVVNRLNRLRHYAVIRCNNQHDNIGNFRATCTHLRKGGVARGIDEGDFCTIWSNHLIGTNMLGNAAGFAACNICLADRVEQ